MIPRRKGRTAGSKLRRPLRRETLERRELLAAELPFGATPIDTGEFLLGSVAVTPVFFESDGSIDPESQDWTAGEIDSVLEKIQESVDWWSDLLADQGSVHSLEFTIDDTYARDPVETGFEPIDRSSDAFERYVGDWLVELGHGEAPSIERAMHVFNDGQRQKHQTDWAFTIFVVDSSDDDDSFFEAGGFLGAFAYAGGLFYVAPSSRPASTFAHEMGHIFWARDEYPGAGSWTDLRGYYNAQNWNAANNPTPGFVQETSIMRGGAAAVEAYNQVISPESTLAQIGWRDSDGDGVFDVLDVPHQLDAAGYFDPGSSTYRLLGTASVDVLANQNSAGTQSDITLARIGELQYRLDGGSWQTAFSPDSPRVEFDIELPIESPVSEISWRALDVRTGITSDIVTSNLATPLVSGNGGFAFLDENENGNFDLGELPLEQTNVRILNADGSDLFRSTFAASELSPGVLNTVDGLTFTALGDHAEGDVSIGEANTIDAGNVFEALDTRFPIWVDQWGEEKQLQVVSEEDVGRVLVDFTALDTGDYGLEGGSYARIEAFDRAGNRLDRVTSPWTAAGQSSQILIEDDRGRIAKVVVYGHYETDILIHAVDFGIDAEQETQLGATFSLNGLADGQYRLELNSPNLVYDFTEPQAFQIVGGQMTPLAIAATRVTSPRHNAALPGDVNGDQLVTARDALAVINDIAQLGNRVLGESERVGLLVDVNDDGIVSVRDALWVINQLARGEEATGEAESTARAVDSGENGGQAQPARIPAAAGTDLDPASQSAPAFQNSSAKNGAGMELGSGTVLDDEQSWGHGGWNRSVDRAIAETSTWESAVDFGDTRQQSDDGGDTADDESAETYDEILTGLHGFGGVYQAFDASSLANRRI